MAQDQVNHPQHYGGKDNPLEVIKVIKHYKLGFQLGNVIKYILRAENKGAPIQDLEKALFYLKDEIEERKMAEVNKPLDNGQDTSSGPKNVTIMDDPSIQAITAKVVVNGVEIGIGDKLELRDGTITGPVIGVHPSLHANQRTHTIAINIAEGITKVYNEWGECYNGKYSIVTVIKASIQSEPSQPKDSILVGDDFVAVGDDIELAHHGTPYHVQSMEYYDDQSNLLHLRLTRPPFTEDSIIFTFDGKACLLSNHYDIVKVIKADKSVSKHGGSVFNIAMCGDVLSIGDKVQIKSLVGNHIVLDIVPYSDDSVRLNIKNEDAPYNENSFIFDFDGKASILSKIGSYDIVKIIKSKDNETKA